MAEALPPPLNRKNSDPEMKDILNLLKKDILLSMNCVAIGTIQSFNKDNQTAELKVNYDKTIYVRDANGNYSATAVPYPAMSGVPCVRMSGGAVSLKMPIEAGDQALIFYNDRDMSNWWAGNTSGHVASGRLHSFSDAIALVGIGNLNNLISGYESQRAVLGDDTAQLRVGAGLSSLERGSTVVTLDDKVKIANSVTDLLTVLNGLIDILSTGFTGATQIPGNPINPTAATQLTAYKTIVEGLLKS